ncbi:unnamed protein product, partial [Ectocarpus sp. 12 AP-2014]
QLVLLSVLQLDMESPVPSRRTLPPWQPTPESDLRTYACTIPSNPRDPSAVDQPIRQREIENELVGGGSCGRPIIAIVTYLPWVLTRLHRRQRLEGLTTTTTTMEGSSDITKRLSSECEEDKRKAWYELSY